MITGLPEVTAQQGFTCLRVEEREAILATVSIAANLKRLRRQSEWKKRQGALADLLGVKQTQLSDWENGRYRDLRASNLIALAKIYRVSVDEILKGVDRHYDQLQLDLQRQASTPRRGSADGSSLGVLAREDVTSLEQIVDAAAILIELGERIRDDGTAILGRQAPAPGLDAPERPSDLGGRDRSPPAKSASRR